MNLKLISAICLGTGVLSFPAFAGPFEDAVKAHDKEDYAQAHSQFKKLAKKKDGRAEFYLGHMYDEGEGVKTSHKTAMKWLAKAAAQGNDNARVTLGYAYWLDDDISDAEAKALELFKLASANDHVPGRYYLALMYSGGFGVEQDPQAAFNLYSQIERLNDWDEHPWNFDRDLVKKRIHDLEEEFGLKETFTPQEAATFEVYQNKRQKQLNTAFQRSEVSRKQREIEEFSRSKAGLVAAGPIENGWSAYSAKDYTRALPILLAHANHGNVAAQTRVGVMYRDGKGVAQDDNTAGRWFQKAETGGSGEAYYHHARLRSWGRYHGGHLLPEQLMRKSYFLGYQPAIDDANRKQAEQDRITALQQERMQKEADEADRRAAYLRANPRRTITNCDGPRPSDAPPVPAGYTCDRRSGSPTYGEYIRRN